MYFQQHDLSEVGEPTPNPKPKAWNILWVWGFQSATLTAREMHRCLEEVFVSHLDLDARCKVLILKPATPRTPNNEQRTPDHDHQTTNTKHQSPNTKHPTSNTRPRSPITKHQTPNTSHQTPNIRHQTPDPDHQTPNIKHQTQNTKQQTREREKGGNRH